MNKIDKEILIIGGTGYIGSLLYVNLLSKYKKVDTIDIEWFGNYSNVNNLKMNVHDIKQTDLYTYDVIIYTAANSSVRLCNDIYSTIDNNIINFINLVQKLTHQKFIYASSSCVYGTSGNLLNTEDDLLMVTDGLSLSKSTIDNFIKLTDVEYYGLRFGSVNGWSPNMRTDLMINSMTLSAINTNEVNVFNGSSFRPILYIEDLCDAIIAITDDYKDNRGIYNVSSFNSNIYDIAKEVTTYTKSKLNVSGDTTSYNFQMSSDKFSNTFNFKFKGNIKSIVDSILNNKINSNWQSR